MICGCSATLNLIIKGCKGNHAILQLNIIEKGLHWQFFIFFGLWGLKTLRIAEEKELLGGITPPCCWL